MLYSRKRLEDNRGIGNYKIFLYFISCVLVATFLVLIYIAAINEDEHLENTAYGMASAAFIIMASLTAYETTRDSKFMIYHFSEKLKEALEDHCDLLNDEFDSRGLEWAFNSESASLECRVKTDLQVIEEVGGESGFSEDSYERKQREKKLDKLNKKI